MIHNKFRYILTLVALFAMTTGAWAQEETLLTTITPTGDGTYSETTAGAVTVTPAGSFFYSGSYYGWQWDSYGSLTVTANEGYTIARCVFIQQGKNQSVTISKAPFALNFEEFLCLENYSMDGVTSIEVYGTAPAAPAEETVTLNHSANNTWAIAEMPGYDVELEVEYFNITVPTANTGDIYAGSTTALINAGSTTEEGATMKYLVTATNEQPASTDGFSADVPTAQATAITGPGTYYVWYYLDLESGDDSEISALAVEVTVSVPTATWVGNSAIYANGTWYYAGNNFDWCTGAFNGANLGTITELSLGGQSQAWADGNANWNDENLTMTMGYKIDGGEAQSLSLNWFEFADNNNKFQSGGNSWAPQDIDISGLTPGNHTIAVWFTRDDKWDSNNSANYVASFSIPATLTANEGDTGEYWATYYNSTTSFTADANTTVYQAALNGSYLTLAEVENREIPAGKAVILKSSAATITLTVGETTATLEGNVLQGTTAAINGSAGNIYVLNKVNGKVGFYKLAATGTLEANKAYLTVSEPTAPSFLGFSFGETTNIQTTNFTNYTNNKEYYDLQGRRVQNPSKGLYIVNGKKVVIK